MQTKHIKKQLAVDSQYIGSRIDQFLSDKFPDFSRANIQQWIKQGHVKVNGNDTKSKTILKGFELIELDIVLQQAVDDQPEAMDLDIRYEDEHLLILNKPAGLVVHPGSGNPSGTLLNGLLALSEAQAMLPRAGIVHRLDKDTSGLMVVAKTLPVQQKLIELLKNHDIERQYICAVKGQVAQTASIANKIGRHRTQRIKMAVTHDGKPAVTHYQPIQQLKHFTVLKVNLETGRTHQIRVHMQHLGHPLIGDALYGNRNRVEPTVNPELKAIVRSFPRQALHAQQLRFNHPSSGKEIIVTAELPEDLEQLLDDLDFYDSKDNEQEQMTVEYCE